MADFLIQTSFEHTMLIIERIGDDMVSLHTNNRTLMLSTPMAEEIMKGLMAILKGGFDRAISETSLRMEEEYARRREPLRSDSATIPSFPKPELDQL